MRSIQESAPPQNPVSQDLPPSEVTLRTIAGWQLDQERQSGFAVELPKLQRGFVWEPAKIMELWDSLLRGFPIGSMMISGIDAGRTQSGTARYWLLDGQQRATSIALGYHNPWTPEKVEPIMWSLKNIPLLWLDLMLEPREWDVKMFFPFLITQSHPWGCNRDGGVIPWAKRREASEAFRLGDNYTEAELRKCFPWQASFPVPLAILLEVANRGDVHDEKIFWTELVKSFDSLPEPWRGEFIIKRQLHDASPPRLPIIFKGLRRISSLRVHLNLLSQEAAGNDADAGGENSLLFIRLNTGGVVLGGEELIFSLFKSAFGEARDAVENCSTDFMAPSKLFGLLVRLAAASTEPARLAYPIKLHDFKRAIHEDSELKAQLRTLINERLTRLMNEARGILCGEKGNAPAFCLPEAVATRTINASPDIFLALLYWLDKGGRVEPGKEAHRQLIGRFTALSWFLPGSAKAKQDILAYWIKAAETDIAGQLWSGSNLQFFFTRKDHYIPLFPRPELLRTFLLDGVRKVVPYSFEKLAASNQNPHLWEFHRHLLAEPDASKAQNSRWESNLMAFLRYLRSCRVMLLYAQRQYIRSQFKAFGQWELTLKETNCPWDWDHLYPSAHSRRNVDPVYKDWHHSIGNLRAVGLSENRSAGCDWPIDKLGEQAAKNDWTSSFILPDIWEAMKNLPLCRNAIKDQSTARKMCEIILKRMVDVYSEWHNELRIGDLMEDIRTEKAAFDE